MIVLLASFSLAQTLDTTSYDFQIIYGKVLVEHEMVFDKPSEVNFTHLLPTDATAVSLSINNQEQIIKPDGNRILISHPSAKTISLEYISKELLEKDTFLINMETAYNTSEFKVTLTLPEGAVLEKPLSNGVGGSIFPKPDKATTDGKSLIFGWERFGLEENSEFAIFTRYKPKSEFPLLTITALLIVVIALSAFIFFRKQKTRVIVKKEDAIEKHLKEDEEQIVNILKKRDGQCEQGTLRVITGFSKASLSRLLKELEDRKIVYKEQRGKKNLVFLRKS